MPAIRDSYGRFMTVGGDPGTRAGAGGVSAGVNRGGVVPERLGIPAALGMALGKKVLMLRGRGGQVDPDTAASARRLIQGRANANDLGRVREFLGISRSGAGFLSGLGKRFGRAERQVQNLARDVSIASAGGPAGQVYLALRVQSMAASLFRDNKPALEKFALGAAQALGAHPEIGVRMLNAVGRGLRLGGVVAAVVGGIAAGAGKMLTTITEGYRARIAAANERAVFGNLPLARDVAAGAESTARQGEFQDWDRMPSWFGEWGRARRAKRSAEIQSQRLAARRYMREAAPMFGATDQRAVRLAAARTGLPPEALTENQITAAQDELIASRVRLDEGFAPWYRGEVARTSSAGRLWLDVSGLWGGGWEELRRQKRDEYRLLRAKTLAQAKADDVKREALAWQRLTPLERIRRVQDQDLAAAELATYRTRHRAHQED